MSFFTRENITFILAVIGSLGTIFNFAYTYFSSRRRIDMQILDYSSHLNVVQFFMYIQNQSRSPICISCISLQLDDKEISCELIPKKIRGNDTNLICTPSFPLNLSSLMGVQYFFEFVNCPDISLASGKTISFVIYTNRGALKKSVKLGDTSRYLHIN